MLRQVTILSLLAAPAAIFVAFAAEEPQLRLLANITAGALQTEAVPVGDFQPSAMPQAATTVRLGPLTFQVPAGALSAGPAEAVSAFVSADGLNALVLEPGNRSGSPTGDLDLSSLPDCLAGDPAALLSAAYAARPQDLSVLMSASQVNTLHALLEAKTLLCIPATRVEVVRGSGLSGVVIIRQRGDRVQIVLEYFSAARTRHATGRDFSGIAYMTVDPAKPEAMELARAIIGSFRIDS
jgi:hypothetical protein